MNSTIESSGGSNSAIYLRCYPYDTWYLLDRQEALEARAWELGMPAPVVYVDNGCRSGGRLDELERLLEAVEAGAYRVVIVPGPFVFSLDDQLADGMVRRFEAAGCRVMEMSRMDTYA